MTDPYANPPSPSGCVPFTGEVTSAMTAWAESVDAHPGLYPMHSYVISDTLTINGAPLLAWVSWHTKQGSTGKSGHFWGVSLFVVTDSSQLPGPGSPTPPASSVTVPAYVEGVDVSHYTGNVHWDELYAQKIQFAIPKCTEYTVDSRFKDYVRDARNAGLLVPAAFHFFHPSQSASDQAKRALDATAGLGLVVACDAEVSDGQPPQKIVAGVRAFCDAVGCSLVYTSPGFWPEPSTAVGGIALWEADWGVKALHVPEPWATWAFWQYAGNVRIVGADGAVDRDRFNGTFDDLKAWTASPPVHPSYDLSTVRGVQGALAALGYQPGGIDGIWGAHTKVAVEAFQKNAGLVIDGIVGSATRLALIVALGQQPSAM